MVDVTLRDNRGNEKQVALAGVPGKGDRIRLEHDGEVGEVGVKEIVWEDGGSVVVAVVDGLSLR